MIFRSLLTTGILLSAGTAHAQEYPGLLHKLAKSTSHQATPGDPIVVPLPYDPGSNAKNFAAKLKVEIEGIGLSKKYSIVRTPPTPRTPNGPLEIRAYVPVEAAGNAKLTVTPINARGKPGKPVIIKVAGVEPAPAPG